MFHFQQRFLETIYGKCLPTKSSNAGSQIIESTALLNLQQQQEKKVTQSDIPKTPQKNGLDASISEHSSDNKSLLNGPSTPFKVSVKYLQFTCKNLMFLRVLNLVL